MTDLQIVTNIDRIEQEIIAILAQNKVLTKKLVSVENEKKLLEEKAQKQAKELRELQKNQKNTANTFLDSQIFAKIVENKLSSEQITELKETIDNYIKEIDRCIAQLSE